MRRLHGEARPRRKLTERECAAGQRVGGAVFAKQERQCAARQGIGVSGDGRGIHWSRCARRTRWRRTRQRLGPSIWREKSLCFSGGCCAVEATGRSGRLFDHKGLGDRIDIFEIEQFVALSIYELGGCAAGGRRDAVDDLVNAYNEVLDAVETDPSLRIKVRK